MKEPVYVKQRNFPSTRGIEKNNLMVREAPKILHGCPSILKQAPFRH